MLCHMLLFVCFFTFFFFYNRNFCFLYICILLSQPAFVATESTWSLYTFYCYLLEFQSHNETDPSCPNSKLLDNGTHGPAWFRWPALVHLTVARGRGQAFMPRATFVPYFWNETIKGAWAKACPPQGAETSPRSVLFSLCLWFPGVGFWCYAPISPLLIYFLTAFSYILHSVLLNRPIWNRFLTDLSSFTELSICFFGIM